MKESDNLPIDRQKLIFSGKVLEDTQTLGECSLKEDDFIILMVLNVTKKVSPTLPEVKKVSTMPTTNSINENELTNSSQLLTGEEYDTCVSRLVDMGFLKEDVIHALRASFNNPERAVEYLTSGSIPNETFSGQQRKIEGTDSFKAICATPQFRQLISILRQNPEQLPSIVEQLSETTPEFIRVIEENKEEFLSLLQDDSNYLDSFGSGDEDDDAGGDEGYSGDEEGGVSGNAVDNEDVQVLHITSEENDSIERLINLGFQRNQAIEAFIACDKNEELAANFLFDNN